MKLLISWVAYVHDFVKKEDGGLEVNSMGPNVAYHRNFFDHDKHLILFADKSSETRAHYLENYIRTNFSGHDVDTELMNVSDPINASEILSKVQSLVSRLEGNDIDVYISPGTPAMQVAWYILYGDDSFNIKLFQTRRADDSKTKKPELISIDIDKSKIPITAMFYKNEMEQKYGMEDYLLTDSVQEVYDRAKLVARTDGVTTLILGESGVGKERLSEFIHDNSSRRDVDIKKVNCSSFSDELLESRLFGYKKGAFTGAYQDTLGYFEEADGGTIFLDEIGDISPYMQQSLLRVLQSGEITPIGSNETKKVDVRVICATNRNLVEMCKNDEFRWDLFYRLAVVELRLPALRYRGKKEVKQLMNFFLKKLAQELKKKNVLSIEKDALEIMLDYTYPGNVRELRNILSRLYVFKEDKISKKDLPDYMFQNNRKKEWSLEINEKEHIQKALIHFEGNQRQTALHLGCSINTLKTKIDKFDLKV